MHTYAVRLNLVLGLLFVLCLVPLSASAEVSVSPKTAGYDDLIGAGNAIWSFDATTTASLKSGDVIQFVFPQIQQGPGFDLQSVSLVATSGIALYQSANGQQLSNKVNDPSFENATDSPPFVVDWFLNNTGSSSAATTSTAYNGSTALQIDTLTSTGPGALIFGAQVPGNASSNYTFSFYARGAVGNETARYIIQGNGNCSGNTQMYNFVSKAFDCVATGPSTFASSSPYVGSTTVSTTYVRHTESFTSANNMSSITIGFVGGGDPLYNNENVYYDAVQVEDGNSATAFNLGGTGSPTPGVQQGGQLAFGYVTSAVATGTPFHVELGGIANSKGSLSAVSDLEFDVKAGTPIDQQQPMGSLAGGFTATTSASLVRAGGAIVSDNNSAIMPTSYATGTPVSFTFIFTATSSIPSGGKIDLAFPSEYSLTNASVATQTINVGGVKVNTGAISTYTQSGENRVILTTSGGATSAGDKITVTVDGLTNPSTAAVYRPFYLFTAKSNGGLIDGSYFGFEPSDFSNGTPQPNDTVHIGGSNTLVVNVRKEVGGSLVPLSGSELSQVKVGVGCPDKQFFVGEHWLNSNSSTTYPHLLDCNYYVGAFPLDSGNSSFYKMFLPPGMKQVQALGGGTTTANISFGVPDSTSTVTITGGVSGKQAFIDAFSDDYQSFSQVFTDTSYATPGFNGSGVGYARMLLKSGQNWNFSLGSGSKSSSGNFTSGGTEYWPPQISDLSVDSPGTFDLGSYAYTPANNTLTVTLSKTGGGQVTDACVGVKRAGGGFFMPPQDTICQPNSGSNYVFKVPTGSIVLQVDRPGFGKPAEFPVGISASSTAKTITLSSPSTYISVTVSDASGNKLAGAPVFAHSSNGQANGITNSNGTTTLYLQPGTYTVEGFAPGFGPLTSQSKTVPSSGGVSASFTVDLGNLRTISGTVTQGGNPVAGLNIGAHGVGSTSGGNGTQTGSDGTYTLYVPPGTYKVGGWSPGTGGLPEQSVDTTSGNVTGKNWTLGGSGTLHVSVFGGADLDSLFAGAFDPTTGRGNGVDTWTTTGSTKTADITLPAGTYDIHVGSPTTGELTTPGTQATITAGNTTNVGYSATTSAALVTLSGTVTASSNPVPNVTVWVSRVAGPGFYSAQTDSSGNYSLKVPDAHTYMVGVKSSTYIASNGDVQVSVSGDTTQNFSLTSAGATISGTVKDPSTNGIDNAWVSAKKTVGGNTVWIGAPTDAAGNYSLDVDSGSTWTLYAEGPCYTRSAGTSVSAGSSGNNVTLQSTAGCSVPTPQLNSVTPASGGQVSKSDMTLNIPANALGSGQSSVSVQLSDAGLVISTPNATPLAGSVKTITATDGDGQSITSLNSNATLAITYDPNDIPSGFSESDLQLGYFDTTSGTWVPVAATVDTTNHIITANVSHFTDYGPILPGVPDAPTGVSASADSSSQITVSWTASPTANYYTIYRSTTNSNFTTSIGTTTSTSYADSGLTASTKYYYEIAGNNDNGEGSNSTSANATTNSSGGSGGGGGGGGGSNVTVTGPSSNTTSTSSATTTTTTTTTTVAPTLAVVPTAVPTAVAAAFGQLTKTLAPGDSGAEVTLLQQMLASDPTLYPGGLVTGYYGTLTEQAVQRFQAKYGIVSAGTPATTGFGSVGPKTLAKLNEVFAGQVHSTQPSSTMAPTVPSYPPLAKSLSLGMTDPDVRILQIALNTDPDTQVSTTGDGAPGYETTYFGGRTLAAVQRFQTKYDLAHEGDSFYGFIGPQTRAKINSILASMSTANAAAPSMAATSARDAAILAQIKTILAAIQVLQAKLAAMQAAGQ